MDARESRADEQVTLADLVEDVVADIGDLLRLVGEGVLVDQFLLDLPVPGHVLRDTDDLAHPAGIAQVGAADLAYPADLAIAAADAVLDFPAPVPLQRFLVGFANQPAVLIVD